jgi:SAM-dependent methyltransferase
LFNEGDTLRGTEDEKFTTSLYLHAFDRTADLSPAKLDENNSINVGRSFHSAEVPIGRPLDSSTFEQKREGESYDDFYRRGGWSYDIELEGAFLLHRIIKPLAISRSSSVLELGCGTGVHAALLASLDLNVTAIDMSPTAIERAKLYLGPSFYCADTASFIKQDTDQFDLIYVRAMSWFHYELEEGQNRNGVDVHSEMSSIMKRVKPGGLFVLQVRTDFSGSYGTTGIRNHTCEQLSDFGRTFGDLVLFQDLHGTPLHSSTAIPQNTYAVLLAIKQTSGY